MAVKLNDYVDDDLIVTAMLFSGLTPEQVADRIRRAGDPRRAFEGLNASAETGQTRKRFGLIKDYLDHLGTGNLEKLVSEGAGVNKDVANAAIYKAQKEVGGTATPTLDRVLFFLGSEPDGGAQTFAARQRPALQQLGRGDAGLMTTRTQYKTGTRPAPPAPAPAAATPGPVSLGQDTATPGAAKPGGAQRAQTSQRAAPRPAQPLQPGAPPKDTLGGNLAGTTTAAQQTAGIRNLPTLAPNASDAEVEKYIRKNYGYSAWILDVPELRGKMLELGREFAGTDVDEARIEGALTGTEWWKTHEGDQRLAIEEKMSDPATYNSKVEGKYRTLAVLTGQAGFSLPEGRLREIARTAYDLGWDQVEMNAALAAEFDYNPETGDQDQSKLVGDLRQQASEYLVPLGEQTIDQWGRQIIAGTSTNEDFTQYARNMAKGMFAHYAADIDAGRTVKQIADPFVQMAARDLELTADQIDLMDPKWRKALELDPETGQPMQMSKWQRTIRTDSSYGWDTTQNARGEAAEFAKKIAESFGRA